MQESRHPLPHQSIALCPSLACQFGVHGPPVLRTNRSEH